MAVRYERNLTDFDFVLSKHYSTYKKILMSDIIVVLFLIINYD